MYQIKDTITLCRIIALGSMTQNRRCNCEGWHVLAFDDLVQGAVDQQEEVNDSGFTVSQQHSVPSGLSATDHASDPPLADAPDSCWVPRDTFQSAEDSSLQTLPQLSQQQQQWPGQQQDGSFEAASSPSHSQQMDPQHVEPSIMPAEALQRSKSLATPETAEQAAPERQPALARSFSMPLQGGISSRSTRPRVRIPPCPVAFASAPVSGWTLASGDQCRCRTFVGLPMPAIIKSFVLSLTLAPVPASYADSQAYKAYCFNRSASVFCNQ